VATAGALLLLLGKPRRPKYGVHPSEICCHCCRRTKAAASFFVWGFGLSPEVFSGARQPNTIEKLSICRVVCFGEDIARKKSQALKFLASRAREVSIFSLKRKRGITAQGPGLIISAGELQQ
jgi:hypothetical protein